MFRPRSKRFMPLLGGVILSFSVSQVALAASVESQVAQSGGIYNVPEGDHSAAGDTAPDSALVELLRPRIPMGDAAYAAMKAAGAESGGNGGGGAVTPQQAGTYVPDPPSLIEKECIVNSPTGFTPPDIHGAVSTIRLVVVTNVDVGIYKKTTCKKLSQVSLKSFFGAFNPPAAETMFDPRVIWDKRTGRFLVVTESRNSGNNDQFLYFAISTSQNATAWHLYRIALSQGANFFCKNATSDFYDYPNVGVNKHKWFVTSNNFPTAAGAYGTIISIQKNTSLTGGGVTAWCWKNLNFNIAPPIVRDDNRRSAFISPGSGGGSSLTRYEIFTRQTTADTLFNRTAYNIATWAGPPDCVQPNGQKLDSLDGRFQSASIQYGKLLWNVHTISDGSGEADLRWYRLKTNAASTVKNTVTFNSFYTDGCLFNPSFATSYKPSAFISSSHTSPAHNAQFFVFHGTNATNTGWFFDTIQTSTTQFANTGLGTSCNASSRGSCRWGDYSSMQIDPSTANGRRAWGCNELTNGATQFDWEVRCSRNKR